MLTHGLLKTTLRRAHCHRGRKARKLFAAAIGLVDAHVRSEVLAGQMLIRASIRSVLLSVDANLPGISDASLRAALKQQRQELESTLTVPDDPVGT